MPKKMKRLSIRIALFACRIALALNGWRTGPRPHGFGVSKGPHDAYWRRTGPRTIESSDFAQAITKTIKECLLKKP